ncbi:MAG: NapC/NirT family cytochrome c [Alphaproteobacteria bacterium]
MTERGLCFTFIILAAGGIAGILFWGGFNWVLEETNKESFCIRCHEMEATPYQELKKTIHYTNRSGVRAICSDCHVPKVWIYKMIRKIKASRELYFHFITGKIDTPEKFEDHRLEMAKDVWAAMKSTDSRECRNCHHINSMDFSKQAQRAHTQHEDSLKSGETCIDCHKGIAHKDVSKLLKKEEPAPTNFDIQ